MGIVNLIPKAEAAEQAIRWEPKSFDIFEAVAREMKKPRKRKPPLNPQSSVVDSDVPPVTSRPQMQPAAGLSAETVEATSAELPLSDKQESVPALDEETLERLREDARAEGWKAGFEDGKASGFVQGKEEGVLAGKEEGRIEGHKTGYYAGYEEGSARGYEEGSAKGVAEGSERGHAEGFQKGREEGHNEGYEAGYKAGNEEGSARARQLVTVLESFKDRLVNAEQDFAEDMLALAVQIADQIMMTALHIQPELLIPVVRQAIQTLPQTSQPIRISVNEQDAELLQKFLNEQGIQDHCKVVTDASVESGGCKIESESSLIDATLKNRRERVLSSIGIYRDWLENRGV